MVQRNMKQNKYTYIQKCTKTHIGINNKITRPLAIILFKSLFIFNLISQQDYHTR